MSSFPRLLAAPFFAAFLSAVSLAAAPADVPQSSAPRELKIGDALPDVVFHKEDGTELHVSDFHGKAVAITFFYSRCTAAAFCPLVGRNFDAAQSLLSRLGIADQCHLISISLDPEHDTPEILASYARGVEADERIWNFATGPEDQVRKVGNAVGLEFNRSGNNIDHNLRTIIIDGQGRIAHVFRGSNWTPQELVAELRTSLRRSR